MEFYAVKVLAALLKPPGLFAVLLLAVAVAARRPRVVRGVGVVGAALLLVLSCGRVADALLDSLSRYSPLGVQQLRTVQAVVILGAGSQRDLADYDGATVSALALERLRYGARLARKASCRYWLPTGHWPAAGRGPSSWPKPCSTGACGRAGWRVAR